MAPDQEQEPTLASLPDSVQILLIEKLIQIDGGSPKYAARLAFTSSQLAAAVAAADGVWRAQCCRLGWR